MNLNTIVEQIRLIFADPEAAATAFSAEGPASAVSLFLRKHLFLLFLFPLFSFAAPLRWFADKDFNLTRDAIGPVFIVSGILLLAMIFDKIVENVRGPELYVRNAPPRNLALFLHLPVSAASVFFLFHFLFGFLMILLGAVYAVGVSVLEISRLRSMSPARAIALYLSSALFLLVPLVGLFFALNLLRTYSIIKYLYL